ncbi:MAG TPA: NAD-dependent epimerase/dehydratase family protein [Opitutus sp.]|nr:NAD-dependent epimerase/dehydratase family protein [Opitutus sp.]
MKKSILITGGAGFIGSHLADELLRAGYRVRVLDCLSAQVHGENAVRPAYLDSDVEFIAGRLEDRAAVRRALAGSDIVCHLAAMVGVGQSMYRIADYTAANNLATAVLLEEIVARPVERLVVASSMSIYGEGLYRTLAGRTVVADPRPVGQLRRHDWEPRDAEGDVLVPMPTPETKPPAHVSVYALSKFDQEQMCRIIGQTYDIPTVALRFFNVYGPRQALSNPYTGVLAIFAARLLNGRAPVIFEDGLQRRDFVNVRDIARACRLALEVPGAAPGTFNVGSGAHRTIHEVAIELARIVGRPELVPEINGRFRAGDIRHCFADISLAGEVLGYQPQIDFSAGLVELAGWLEGQVPVDRAAEVSAELSERGLTL